MAPEGNYWIKETKPSIDGFFEETELLVGLFMELLVTDLSRCYEESELLVRLFMQFLMIVVLVAVLVFWILVIVVSCFEENYDRDQSFINRVRLLWLENKRVACGILVFALALVNFGGLEAAAKHLRLWTKDSYYSSELSGNIVWCMFKILKFMARTVEKNFPDLKADQKMIRVQAFRGEDKVACGLFISAFVLINLAEPRPAVYILKTAASVEQLLPSLRNLFAHSISLVVIAHFFRFLFHLAVGNPWLNFKILGFIIRAVGKIFPEAKTDHYKKN